MSAEFSVDPPRGYSAMWTEEDQAIARRTNASNGAATIRGHVLFSMLRAEQADTVNIAILRSIPLGDVKHEVYANQAKPIGS